MSGFRARRRRDERRRGVDARRLMPVQRARWWYREVAPRYEPSVVHVLSYVGGMGWRLSVAEVERR